MRTVNEEKRKNLDAARVWGGFSWYIFIKLIFLILDFQKMSKIFPNTGITLIKVSSPTLKSIFNIIGKGTFIKSALKIIYEEISKVAKSPITGISPIMKSNPKLSFPNLNFVSKSSAKCSRSFKKIFEAYKWEWALKVTLTDLL